MVSVVPETAADLAATAQLQWVQKRASEASSL
jgi:hypothetical protein